MGDNVFGMDIRRFSVLVIATIILLSLLASFANIKVPQNTSTIQIGSGGGSEGSYSVPGPKYIYNKTVTLSPSLQDLQYFRGSYSNLPAPYYNISKCAYILFNFSTPSSNMLQLLLNALAWNASIVAPGPYSTLLSIASSAYVNIISYKNTSLQPSPLNENDTENYSKWDIIVEYGKTFEAPNGFQSGWSYPPSDYVVVNPLVFKTIKTYSVTTSVNVILGQPHTYLVHSSRRSSGHIICYYYYYAMSVSGTAYFYVNNELNGSQSFSYTFYWGGGSHPSIFYDTVTVPPGVSKQVYASYTVSAGAGFSYHRSTFGNTTYICISYYPTGPYTSTLGYQFNWYQYNITLPLKITIFNGTSPITYVNNNTYYNRTINAVVSYTTWSSLPQDYSVKILTHDTIQVGNYSITRMWNAGTASIIPKANTQRSGNVINYYLTFNVQCNLAKPPAWIYQDMLYNKYAALDWFYLEQNATLAHALYSYIMNTINKSDLQFWKFEYFILASEFVMYTYNTTYSVFNNLLELESFYENWSLVSANILNLSAWPNLEYFNNLLMSFNVSKIPPIYNNTIFYNITGNYEVYLVDVYNALGYSQFNKVPFGNEYYFNPTDNKTIYFYLNMTKQPIPYVGQTLYFTSANYVPVIFYATFQYPPETPVKITTIWNGTAWVT